MHPHTHVMSDDWMMILDKHGFLTAEKFFEMKTKIYDAISECCKGRTV